MEAFLNEQKTDGKNTDTLNRLLQEYVCINNLENGTEKILNLWTALFYLGLKEVEQ